MSGILKPSVAVWFLRWIEKGDVAIIEMPSGEAGAVADMMAKEDGCMREPFVLVRFAGRKPGVPLAQLEPVGADAATREAVEDWWYWVATGYEFCTGGLMNQIYKRASCARRRL